MSINTKLLKAKPLQKHLLEQVRTKVTEYTNNGVNLHFSVISVGDDEASHLYVKKKIEIAEECGIETHHISLPVNTSQNNLEELIDALNNDKEVTAILLQLPLPKHLDGLKAVNKIATLKDVDGLTATNTGLTAMRQNDAILPATPLGIMRLLKYAKIEPKGKVATVIGQSHLVGRPLSNLLVDAGATVINCHIDTNDVSYHLKNADIIVSAVGNANFISGEILKQGAVAIDVGMNRDENGKLCGDINIQSCMGQLSAITPVPGGIGPMTVTSLMTNIIDAYTMQNNLIKTNWQF